MESLLDLIPEKDDAFNDILNSDFDAEVNII